MKNSQQQAYSINNPPPYYGPNKPKRRPLWVRVLFWGLTGLLAFLALLVIIAIIFNKQITLKALNAASEGLKTEVKISDVELSLIKGFPDASIIFQNIRVDGTFKGRLLEAEELSMRFGLFSLFSDDVVVKKIVLKNGKLAIRKDRRGNVNYDIFKPEKEQNDAKTALVINLNHAILENMDLRYEDEKRREYAVAHIDKAEFAGEFSEEEYDMESKADIFVNYLQLEKERYLSKERIKYDAIFKIDNIKQLYAFEKMNFNLGGNSFDINGTVRDRSKYSEIALNMQSQRGDVSGLFKLLPARYSNYFKDFKSEGTYQFAGAVKGKLSNVENPSVSFRFALQDGKIVSEKLNEPLSRVSFDANLRMDNRGAGHLNVDNFYATFDGQPIRFSLKLDGFEDPMVDFSFSGAVPVKASYGLLENELITEGTGLLKIPNLNLKGRYSNMNSMYMVHKVDLSGAVEFEDAAIKYNGGDVVFKSGRMDLKDNVFSLGNMKVLAAESDFLMSGKVNNLLPVLFSDSLNTKDAYLDFDATLLSENLDVDALMDLFSEKTTEREAGGLAQLDSAKVAKNAYRNRFTEKLKGTFKSNIQAFNFNKIEGKDFKGDLTFDHHRLIIDGDAKTMKGAVHFEGETFFDLAPFMKMRITLKGIDLEQCFRQCDSFDQEVITDKNIEGKLSGRVAAYLYWSPKGDFLMDNLRVYADLLGHDGALRDVKTMEDFSTFIHIDDLRDVQFSTLQNYLEISRKRLVIPAMFFQSNACNLTFSGTQTFDNDINYFVKVNAGQVLLNRLRRNDGNLDPLPAENGLFNLYYVIRGNLDDYKMFRGKRSVQADFERSEAKKREILTILDKEFGGSSAHASNDGSVAPARPNEEDLPTTTGINHAPPVYEVPDEEEEFLDEIEAGGGSNE